MAATPGPPARTVAFSAMPTGELGVAAGRFLTVTDAGHAHAHAVVSVRNQTGAALEVRLRAAASTAALDGAVSVSFAAGGHELMTGTLGDARSWSPQSFVLPPGTASPVDVTVSLARRTADEPEDVAEDVAVSFSTTRAGS